MKTAFILASFLTIALGAPTAKRQADNLQTFTSALGGLEATPVVDSSNPDRPFQVKDATFVNIGGALQRSCDQQFNACADAANGGDESLSVADCSAQKDQCSASIQASEASETGAGANGNADANANANNGCGGARKTKRSTKSSMKKH